MKHALTLAKPVWGYGKHAVITGGSSGIGLEVAKRLTGVCRKITLIARNENAAMNPASAPLAILRTPPKRPKVAFARSCARSAERMRSSVC